MFSYLNSDLYYTLEFLLLSVIFYSFSVLLLHLYAYFFPSIKPEKISFSSFFRFLLIAAVLYYFSFSILILFDLKRNLEPLFLGVFFLTCLIQFARINCLLSGGIIKLLKLYKTGDFVIIGKFESAIVVDKLGLLNTYVYSQDQKILTLKNSEVLLNPIINISKHKSYIHTQYIFDNLFDEPCLLDTIEDEVFAVPKIIKWPRPKIDIKTYNNKEFYLIDIWVWCMVKDHKYVEEFLNTKLKSILREKNINVY